jgi:uncharacterized protein
VAAGPAAAGPAAPWLGLLVLLVLAPPPAAVPAGAPAAGALAAAAARVAEEPALPALTGRVVDEAAVLAPEAAARLARALAAHERATGEQVVVATVRSMRGRTVEEFANRLFRHWRLGGAEADDGVLLLVAPNERKVRIEVGYGLEGVLTDAAASAVVQSLILPRFRAGDLAGGVEAGARGVLELLRPEGEAAPPGGWAAPPRPRAATGVPWPTLAVLGLVALLLLARLLQGRRPPRGPYRRGYHGGRRGAGGLGYPPVIVIPGGFGRGGGGGGGGGFSGGGGSSGGGGASGSW